MNIASIYEMLQNLTQDWTELNSRCYLKCLANIGCLCPLAIQSMQHMGVCRQYSDHGSALQHPGHPNNKILFIPIKPL